MLQLPDALDHWYLTGPTASGKTTIGIELSKLLDAEIISLDSMSIYRGMNIGTAKPTAEQLSQAPHHLIDIRDPNEDFSVSQYVELVANTVKEIQSRDKQVLFVGGTPLYLKSLIRGLFEGPPADQTFRDEVLREVEEVGTEALHQRLEMIDPVAATKLHPNDTRRIIRALEVYKLTGKPISHQQLQFDEGSSKEDCRVFVLDWPRPVLHQRINDRVSEMFAAGFVEEVTSLIDRYGTLSKTARQAVGYAEVERHLAGELDVETTISQTQARTRQFAKRQITWFRSLSECRWLPQEAEQTPESMARLIAEAK